MKSPKARKLPSLLGFEKTVRRNGQETHGANKEDGKPDKSSCWQEYLETPPSQIELPLDYAKRAGHLPELATETIILPASIAEPLKELSTEPGVNLCSVMLAGFYTLLYRYCKQEDIIIALTLPDDSRITLPENESGNRFFSPLRLVLEKDSPFQDLITRAGNALSAIHDCFAPIDSEISHDILFSAQEISVITQLAFTYLKKTDPVSISSGNAPFPVLALAILDEDESLSASLRYDRKLFAADTIKRMLHHYCNLLLAATQDPLQTISQLEMLSEKERHQVLVEWNRTDHPYPQQDYLHQMFESQVEKMPDAVAIVHKKNKLTYLALNRKANRLAHYLRAQGLTPGKLVGIYMKRTIDAVIAILGVLKAGGAYLPLDAGYPKERLDFIIKDSRASFLITHEQHKAGLGESAGTILCLDSLDKELSKHPNENPAGCSQEQDIAFVLYTSGSTGNPKGVQVTHGNMINNCFLWEHTFQLSSTITAICQMAFFSFAVFQGDLFRALSSGKKLVICPNATLMSPRNLYELMQQEKIDFGEFVPTILRELSHYVTNNGLDLHFMKIIIVSADRWYVREHQEIQRLCGPGTSLVHVYGLSETSLDSTFFLGTDLDLNQNQLTPIGRPFPNVRTYILDDYHKPVPVGITGELYIGGAGVAKGYLHRPDLTSECFMADPFSNEEHDRIFRTGDLARYLPDGNIAFLGRADQQIKIRGFRVEPGEIEDQLTKHFQIRNAIVQPWEPAAGVIQLVAYYVAQQDPPPPPEILRAYLAKVLPDFMIPSRFIPLESLPLTPSGKVNRSALPQPTAGRPELEQPFIAPKGTTEELIAALWRDLLQIDDIGALDNLFDLGGTSLVCIQTVAQLAEQHNIDIPVTTIFQHPTVRALAHIIDETPATLPTSPMRQRLKRSNDEDTRIAIIAEAGRFPGANTIEQFWQNLRNGVESISFFSDSELDADTDPTLRHNPHFVKARGIVADAELFDAPFFGISPLEAKVMDPQQRLFLEIAYEAMERAGYNPKSYAGKIGVFAGSNNNSYFLSRVQKHPDLVKRLGDFQIMIANEKDYIATHVAHKLNLKGPALSIYTACSTSLVAIVSAVDNLLNYNCDMALAGGVALTVPQRIGYVYEEGAIFSKDGHTRPFDADATGTVFSDGAGVVLLKRFTDAQRDGDEITAVIRGAAFNNDGADKMSFTAPSATGQVDVIADALAKADVTADTISYVETHGTATPLGDPIEISALSQVFRKDINKNSVCAIGSIKSNLGHLTAAAGVAGLIKTALALKYGEIPPSLHFHQANPQIDFDNSPFFVNAQLRHWEQGETPRRAGVSSFGIGGTNAHAILEEAPPRQSDKFDSERPYELMIFSARNAAALSESIREFSDFLASSPSTALADAAFTQRCGRAHYNHRKFFVCQDNAELTHLIASPNPACTGNGTIPAAELTLAFLFPGQGSQYVGMGRSIYEQEPIFAQSIDQCAEILQIYLGEDIRDILYPDDDINEGASERLKQTRFAQPAIFIIEYALAQLWLHWGVAPQAMIGHSIGEFVCACLAGVFSLEDALKLVAIRADLMQKMPPGSMLSVQLTAAELESRIGDTVEIACINEPSLCVLSGPKDAIASLQVQFEKEDIGCRPLHTSHGFHSSMMGPAVAGVLETVKSISLSPPQIPYVSTSTGKWITDNEAIDPNYWANHLRKPVLFAPGIKTLCDDGQNLLLEVGPRPTLTTLARRQLPGSEHIFAASLAGKPGETEWRELLTALGKLWINGMSPDWTVFSAGKKGRRTLLPTYPFQRKRCWIDAVEATQESINPPLAAQGEGATENLNFKNEEQNMTSTHNTRASRLVPKIQKVLEEVSGLDIAGTEAGLHFFDLGLESLALTQAASVLKQRFSVDVSFRQLTEELNTCAILADFLDSKLPPEVQPAPTNTTPVSQPINQAAAMSVQQTTPVAPVTAPASPSFTAGTLESIIVQQAQQIAILAQQLQMLTGNAPPAIISAAAMSTPVSTLATAEATPAEEQKAAAALTATKSDATEECERTPAASQTPSPPPVPGAQLGRDPQGNPAWFIADPQRPGKYLRVTSGEIH